MTMSQRLTAILGELETLIDDVGTALTPVPTGANKAAVQAAIVTLGELRTAAAALPEVADTAIGEDEYVPTVKLRNQLAVVLTAFGAVPALAGAPTTGATDLRTRLTTLAGQMLPVMTALRVPQHGVPSVGFEYEMSCITVQTAHVQPKALLARWAPQGGGPGVRLEVDGGHVEFVTEPATTIAQVRAQVQIIRDQVAAIRTAPDRTVEFRIPEPMRSSEDGRIVQATGFRVVVRHAIGSSTGRIQATAACALLDLPEMVAIHASANGLGGFPDDPANPEAVALARIVNYYICSLAGRGARTDQQGPKVILPVMLRTSLRALYLGLPALQRTHFQTLIEYNTGNATGARSSQLVEDAYLGPAGAEETGPLVGEWLDSIVDGGASTVDTEPLDRDVNGTGPRGPGFDLMSPPPGYPAHRRGRHFTYAMGLFDVAADGSALAETREIWPTGEYGLDNFSLQVEEFAAQRFETVAARRLRVDARVQTEVAHICGYRNSRASDAAKVLARLANLPHGERELARNWLIPDALDAYVPPPRPVQAPLNVNVGGKRKSHI